MIVKFFRNNTFLNVVELKNCSIIGLSFIPIDFFIINNLE